MQKRKISFRDILSFANRITGFSLPFGGISWETRSSEFEVAERIVTFLENKRVLYAPTPLEIRPKVLKSVEDIRTKLGDELENLLRNSQLTPVLQKLQFACREFINIFEETEVSRPHDRKKSVSRREFIENLIKFRHAFAIGIAQMSINYEIDVSSDLEGMLKTFALEKNAASIVQIEYQRRGQGGDW